MLLTAQSSLQLTIHSCKYKTNLVNENMNDAQALPIYRSKVECSPWLNTQH